MNKSIIAIPTDDLHKQILKQVVIQKTNPHDSAESFSARIKNRPLLAEMARREEAGEPVPLVQ